MESNEVTSFLEDRIMRIHGVKIHAVQTQDVVEIIKCWVEGERQFHYLSSSNANNVIMALESGKYFQVMENADLSIPDSVPFLWYGRMKGYPLYKRCGIEEVMLSLFDLSNQGLDYRHYFYGNTQKVLDELKARLVKRYPKLNIAGMYSPPFRKLTPEEENEHIRMINDSNADFLWVSLGCPKQERWLYDHREHLNVVLGGGAGAVFNLLSYQSPKVPKWVRYIGMEWFMRLLCSPRRLWRRYLVKYPKFLLCFVFTGLKRNKSVDLEEE